MRWAGHVAVTVSTLNAFFPSSVKRVLRNVCSPPSVRGTVQSHKTQFSCGAVLVQFVQNRWNGKRLYI